MFGDKCLVFNLNVMPDGKLQCWPHILNYHCTWEAKAKLVTKLLNMNGNKNPADIVTNSSPSNSCTPSRNLFCYGVIWISSNIDVSEGSEKRSETPPLSQANGKPQQPFKLGLWHILGE